MKKTLVALFLCSLLGLVTSGLLTRLHLKVSANGFEEKSFCNVSEFVDCDTVIASRYSHIGSIPTAELGMIYYLLVCLGLLYAAISKKPHSTLAFLFASSLFASLYSVVMAYISFVKLEVLCLLCLTSYLANFLMFFLFPKALGLSYAQVPRFLGQYVASLFGGQELKPRLPFHLGMTVLITAVGLLFFRGLSPQTDKIPKVLSPKIYLKSFRSLPQKEIDTEGHPFWGNPKAKVTIVEFSDFQCPFCRRAAFTLKPYLKQFPNAVRFVFFNYPLDSACNPSVQQMVHPVACLAAKAALCAQKQGKFWEYHDQIFENQKRLSRATLLNIAQGVGLETTSFEQCLVSDEISEALKKDVEEGGRLEVRGTPTLFINGRSLRDWLDPNRLRMVIEEEISTAPAAVPEPPPTQ